MAASHAAFSASFIISRNIPAGNYEFRVMEENICQLRDLPFEK